MLFIDIVLPVFLIVLSGFVLEKTAHLDFRTLTVTSLYLLAPALVFSSLMEREIDFSLTGSLLLFMVLYTAVLYAVSLTVGRLCYPDQERRRALHLTTVMMNVGNFGLPLAFFTFGKEGIEVSVLTFVIFNIPLGTLGIVIAQGSSASLGQATLNMLKIPIFHGVALAFLFKALHIEVPPFLLRPMSLVGQAAIPIMLIMLGMQLARTQLRASLGFLSLSSFMRLILAPLLAWFLTGLIGLEGMTRAIVVLQTSTPSAVLPLLYSLRFGTRPDLVAGAIFVSTLLSAATLTGLLYFLR